MPRADFIEGGLYTLRWCGWVGMDTIHRDLTRPELDAAVDINLLRNEWFGFWATHGVAIEAAPGLPGLGRDGVPLNTSWQAGHDLSMIRARRKAAFGESEWGAQLAAAMNASAAALGPCVVDVVDGLITVVRG
jgi:hypothetical protein